MDYLIDFIICLIATYILWAISAALMNWLFNTPMPKKKKYIRTIEDIENKMKEL